MRRLLTWLLATYADSNLKKALFDMKERAEQAESVIRIKDAEIQLLSAAIADEIARTKARTLSRTIKNPQLGQ